MAPTLCGVGSFLNFCTMISPETSLIVFLCCSMAHFVMTMVMALFARHQVKFLSIAWIMGIFATALLLFAPYKGVATGQPGLLHPYMLMALLVISYLQSIFPLSIPMPGYLQWGRMWRYALPALLFIGIYVFAILLGSQPVIIRNLGDLRAHLLSGDILLRLGMLLTSFWYIINIFRLPHHLTHVEYPRYLVGYSTMLGLSAIFYVIIAIDYDSRLMMIYAVIFTLLNLYLCFRTLETMARELPKPVIKEVEKAPTDEELRKAEEDFNEANRQRFQRLEFWMQNNMAAWTDSTFTRDNLCRETGLNRHLVLECLRNQGYNNVHEYINSYRLNELKRRIRRGQVNTFTECLDAGFGSVKTVRSAFLKSEGTTLDLYMQTFAPKKG